MSDRSPPPPPSGPVDHTDRPMNAFNNRYRQLQLRGWFWLAIILVPILGLMAFACYQKHHESVEKASLQTRNLNKTLGPDPDGYPDADHQRH
mgnify:FL=1